jgi:hypothetical protein
VLRRDDNQVLAKEFSQQLAAEIASYHGQQITEQPAVIQFDPTLATIANYRADRLQLNREHLALSIANGWHDGMPKDKQKPWIHARMACDERLFTSFLSYFGRSVDDGFELESPRHLWVFIDEYVRACLESRRLDADDLKKFPDGRIEADSFIKRVLSALHHFGFDWSERPPYPKRTIQEWRDSMSIITNKLEKLDLAGELAPEKFAPLIGQCVNAITSPSIAPSTRKGKGKRKDWTPKSAIEVVEFYVKASVRTTFMRLCAIVNNRDFNVDEQLDEMERTYSLPRDRSADSFARLLGTSATAIKRSKWWRTNRAGEKLDRVGNRHARQMAKYAK